MDRLNFIRYLHVGSLELNRYQELEKKNFSKFINPLIVNPGLIINKNWQGLINDDWRVTAESITSIRIKTGKAFILDSNQQIAGVELEEDRIISMPSPDGIYKILLKHAYTNYEEGTITVTSGSVIVTGSGTEFTKIFEINRRLIVNGETYPILRVNSDTELELADEYLGATTSGLNFMVGGWWTNPPVAVEDNVIYEHDALEIIVKTTAKVAGEYWLAEVTMNGGIITNITDKRNENIYELFSESPKLTSTDLRIRKQILFAPLAVCSSTVNENAAALTEHIKANDSHPTTFQEKLRLRFYKSADDKLLTVNFKPFYTDNGLDLSPTDAVKWQSRIDITGQSNGTEEYLSENTITYDVSGLTAGYYEMVFKLKKAATAFNLSILINEIFLTGNNWFVVE